MSSATAARPGELWNEIADRVRRDGGRILLGERVVASAARAGVRSPVAARGGEASIRLPATTFISTIPIRDLVGALDPPAPAEVAAAAGALRYRDFLMVAVVLDRADVFPDQWIYIHDPRVAVGRIQNFKNWSAEHGARRALHPARSRVLLLADDELGAATDADLLAQARRELATLGLVNGAKVVDGTVVRQRNAYPVYDHHYQSHVGRVRRFVDAEAANLLLAGRNGMHKYNNQDHAMLTGLMAARNILGGGVRCLAGEHRRRVPRAGAGRERAHGADPRRPPAGGR